MRGKIFIIPIFILTLFTLFVAGCANNVGGASKIIDNNTANIGRKIKIVTSFYPLYEIAKNVGGDLVDIKNLVSAGTEPHDYEPTPKDILNIRQAGLVIVNGAGLEPWFDKIRGDLDGKSAYVFDMATLLSKRVLSDPEFGAMWFSEKSVTADPHFWLDPAIYAFEIWLVADKLQELYPRHGKEYKQNAQRYVEKIQALDLNLQKGLANCGSRTLVTNHNAFEYLAKRYNLETISISGFSPEAEVSPKNLAKLIKIMKEKNIRYIFTETLVSPKNAEILAAEAGVKTIVLNPLEGLTEAEIAAGKNYISVMEENLQNLKTALACS